MTESYEISHGDSPTDSSIAVDEPELHLPGPRAIPVELVNITKEEPPQNISANSYALLAGTNIQVANADPLRRNLCLSCIANNSVTSIQGSGSLTNPGANAVVAQITGVPSGTYLINWSPTLSGTVTSADASNMQLVINGVPVATAITGSTAGNAYPQTPVTVTVPANSTISVNSIAAGSGASAIYRAAFSAAPSGSGNIWITHSKAAADLITQLGGVSNEDLPGFPMTPGMNVELLNTAGVWAAATGTNMIVGVIAERQQQ